MDPITFILLLSAKAIFGAVKVKTNLDRINAEERRNTKLLAKR
jgi:hypothetical protein